MIIYSNGIVIMWQASCCAVCLASDRPVIRGVQHIHHRHFNNPTNEPGATPTAALPPPEEERWLQRLWKCSLFLMWGHHQHIKVLKMNWEWRGAATLDMLWWGSVSTLMLMSAKTGGCREGKERRKGRVRLAEQVRVKSIIHRVHYIL